MNNKQMDQSRIKDLAALIKKRENDTHITKENLNLFAKLLFDALGDIFTALNKEGVTSFSEIKREHQSENIEQFSFEHQGERLIFVSGNRVALPGEYANLTYESIVQNKETGMAGRLIVFAQPQDDPLNGFAMYDYFVFSDRSWIGWGANSYPKYETSINEKVVYDEAINFVTTLYKKNNRVWRSRSETHFEQFIKDIFSQTRFTTLTKRKDDQYVEN